MFDLSLPWRATLRTLKSDGLLAYGLYILLKKRAFRESPFDLLAPYLYGRYLTLGHNVV
jgi:hypothetical protein